MSENQVKEKEEDKPEEAEQEGFGEILKAIIIAGVLALSVRCFAYEPFNIPSGSMIPSLLVGDYLFVSKHSYGYSKYAFPLDVVNFKGRVMFTEPERGDVIVFRQPKKLDVDYIKRLIGLPGDRVQVISGRLHINGEIVERELIGEETDTEAGQTITYNSYVETLPNGVKHKIYEISDDQKYDNTPEYIVPEKQYFMMGDNRDRSLDSRATNDVGMVPRDNLIGEAQILFFSKEPIDGKCDIDGFLKYPRIAICNVFSWPFDIRYSRTLNLIE